MTRMTAQRGRTHHVVRILALLLTFGPIALGCPAPTESGKKNPDEGATRPPRILSLSPLATRFLDQLGLGDRILPQSPTTPVRSASPAERAVDFAELARLEPDFVFLPALPDDRTDLAPLEASGARIVEFAPHDLEDLLALLQGVGVELAGKQGVEAFERRVLRPVAMVAGQSSPTDRLRAVAVVGIDPPEIAGGHSFETDLIEIAGATSLTHGADDNRRPIDRDGLAEMKPDLVLVMTEAALPSEERERVLDLAGGIAPVAYFEFARETFWLGEPVREAKRLRELIVAAEVERRTTARP